MTSREVWSALEQRPDGLLIDVRTTAEWAYVGVPDLSSLNREVLHLEWARFPDMAKNPDFADSLVGYLTQPGDGPNNGTPNTGQGGGDLFFLCRSGVRSRAAAQAVAARLGPGGAARCVNVSDGFEGDRDQSGHRNTIGGWRAAELPWKQG